MSYVFEYILKLNLYLDRERKAVLISLNNRIRHEYGIQGFKKINSSSCGGDKAGNVLYWGAFNRINSFDMEKLINKALLNNTSGFLTGDFNLMLIEVG